MPANVKMLLQLNATYLKNISHFSILALQWKEDVATALEHLNKAIEMDEKCQFVYETLGSIEIQRLVNYFHVYDLIKLTGINFILLCI